MHDASPEGSLVLSYHRMGSPFVRSIVRGQYVLPSLFRRQLDLLSSMGYKPVTLAEMLAHPERAGQFNITFDDGYKSVGDLGYPILLERRVPATVFVVTGAVGKTNEWDVRIGDRTEEMLSLAQIREMSANGIEMGAHTISHAHLPALSDRDLKAEVQDSKKALEDMLGKPVTGFCYPYGEWDARVRDAAVNAGYEYAVSTLRGTVNARTDNFSVPRVNIRWNTFGGRLRRKIGNAYQQQAQRDLDGENHGA